MAGPEGLFWSMRLGPGAQVVTPMISLGEIALGLLDASGAEIDRGRPWLTDRAGVTEVPLTGGLQGSLFAPSGAPPRRALGVLGGSEGGCRRDLAALIASRLRVPALALAYFGVPGSPLPRSLQEIPLEVVTRALDWLDSRPEVIAGCHAVLGISRGAELALLVVEATTIPVERIGGPVLLVGSGLDGVWPSDAFVDRIASRLRDARFAHPVTALTYPSSGHLVQDGHQPTTLTRTVAPGSPVVLDLGGTPEGTAAANADSWPRLLAFLEGALL